MGWLLCTNLCYQIIGILTCNSVLLPMIFIEDIEVVDSRYISTSTLREAVLRRKNQLNLQSWQPKHFKSIISLTHFDFITFRREAYKLHFLFFLWSPCNNLNNNKCLVTVVLISSQDNTLYRNKISFKSFILYFLGLARG